MATAVSSKNVAVGKPDIAVSGGVLVAPSGTERPSTHAGPYDAAYTSVGYVSDEGVTETSERSNEDIRAWGGQKIRSVQTEFGTTVSFTLIESRNAEALKLVFGDDNVSVANGEIVVKRNEKVLPHRQFIIDMLDGENSRHLDIGNGQVTEVGDISYVDGEAISYEVTVSCDPDDNGDTLVERIQTEDTPDGGSGE